MIQRVTAACAVSLALACAAPARAEGDGREWPVFTRGAGPVSPTAEEVAAQEPDAGILGLATAPKTVSPREARAKARADARVARAERAAARRSARVGVTEDDAPATSAALPPSGDGGGVHAMVTAAAQRHGVPPAVAHAIVQIESKYNARAAHAGNYGLMQIRLQTARGVGYSGSAAGLLDPNTNLTYGMKYLAGAHRLAGGDLCGTIMRYQGGHRAERMSGANRAYCAKARTIMASR